MENVFKARRFTYNKILSKTKLNYSINDNNIMLTDKK